MTQKEALQIKYDALARAQAVIMEWFKAHDYYSMKILTGEWLETDAKWTQYLHDREFYRAEYDRIDEARILISEQIQKAE